MKWWFLIITFCLSSPTWAQEKKPSPVLVAVVDMGIDYYNLKYLKSYMHENHNFQRGWDFGQKEASMGIDYNYQFEGQHHGTFIAYLIARPQFKNTQRISLLDVVYSDYEGNLFKLNQYMFPENNLQVYRRKKAYEQFSTHLSETFAYAERTGARVINFSSSDSGFKSEAMEEYLKEAGTRKTFIIVSAGNDSSDVNKYPEYPCNYKLPNVICVGAVDRKNQQTEYTNYGLQVDIYALGNFGSFKGSSFSAPIISRAVALILYSHPTWSVTQVRKELFKYVEVVNHLPVFNIKKFHQKYL
jgi:hypothetical protein